MNLGIKNRVALVTGASRGIGQAVAVGLAREGARVVAHGREQKDLAALVAEIERSGGQVKAVASDLATAAGCDNLARGAAQAFGAPVEILVNNAGGIGSPAAFADLSDEDWSSLFDLNVLGVVRVVRALLPAMQERRWGRIINVASESGMQPDAEMPHYNATKAAILNLTKSLSKQYGPDGILVNAVSPAFIDTPLVEKMLQQQADARHISKDDALRQFLEQHRPNITARRPGTAEEAAAPILFLASEAASFVNGSNYRVDSGSVGVI